jgi:hypothetical protein
MVAPRIGHRSAHESDRRQGKLGDLVGPQEGRVKKAARNQVGEHGAKLADQLYGDHCVGKRIDEWRSPGGVPVQANQPSVVVPALAAGSIRGSGFVSMPQ